MVVVVPAVAVLVSFCPKAALRSAAWPAIPVRLARTTLMTVRTAERPVTRLLTTLAVVLCDSSLMSREAFTTHPIIMVTWTGKYKR